MEASIITTYRCNCRCRMCDVWKYPTDVDEEIKPSVLEKLPQLDFCNVTGGEPFLRDDIEDIIAVLKKKAKRIVISTNGFFTDKILALAEKNNDIGIRVSIEGLKDVNDELRGIDGGFDHGLATLKELQKIGLKDVGFGITVSDRNPRDMLELFKLSESMNLEFATAAIHNSYYFHKYDNEIEDKDEVVACFAELIDELLRGWDLKKWFRAYFNYGLINYIKGNPRLLPCEVGTESFFVDPSGEVIPCNGLEESVWMETMGNLNDMSFADIWSSERAEDVRARVKDCPKNCWMIGNVAPVMKKYIRTPLFWVIKNKLRSLANKGVCID